MTYRYHLKLNDGRLIYSDGADIAEAIRTAGVSADQVRRHMPVKCLDAAKPMPEDVKARLAQLKAERREVCAPRRKAPRLKTLDTGEKQTIIPQTPPRTVPDAPLRAKRRQHTDPLPLEMPAIEAKQGRLF